MLPSQISRSFNITDVGTKPLSKKRLVAMMGEIGMIHVESGEPVGEVEREELRTYGPNSKNISKIAKAVLKFTALMGLEPMPVAAQEGTCNIVGQKDNTFWISVSLMMLACAWMAICFSAFWFWRKLDRRLYYDELQIAEDDTTRGKHRDELSTLQAQLISLRGRFESHVERYDGEFELLEDYGDIWRFHSFWIGRDGWSCEAPETFHRTTRVFASAREGQYLWPSSARTKRNQKTQIHHEGDQQLLHALLAQENRVQISLVHAMRLNSLVQAMHTELMENNNTLWFS